MIKKADFDVEDAKKAIGIVKTMINYLLKEDREGTIYFGGLMLKGDELLAADIVEVKNEDNKKGCA